MPKTKHAIIRYQALDKCFRNSMKRYFIDDLVASCRSAIENYTGNSEGVKKRQVYDDINFMMSENGYSAPIEKAKIGRKVFYFYEDRNFSINNQPLTEDEASELKETLLALQRFKGLPQFEWIESLATRLEASFQLGEAVASVIEYEENEFLQGREFIKPLYHSIIDKNVLVIDYKSFHSSESQKTEFHPYYLKQYNNRWFVFGQNPEFDNITTLALDRIQDIESKYTVDYIETSIDFKDYFEDILGVTYLENTEIQKVHLKVAAQLFPYIATKPLHGSQRVVGRGEDSVEIMLKLIPNYELESKLLSFGEGIAVLKPVDLREKLKTRIAKMNEKYMCADSVHR